LVEYFLGVSGAFNSDGFNFSLFFIVCAPLLYVFFRLNKAIVTLFSNKDR
jgi:hypothetical protein